MDIESVTSSVVSRDQTLTGADHTNPNNGALPPPYEAPVPEQPSHLETCKYWCVWACYVSKDVVLISFAVLVALGFLVVWPSIMIHMGRTYLHECSYYPFIPINLVIMGVSVFVICVAGLFAKFLYWVHLDDRWYFDVTSFVVMITTLAFMGCFVLSNVVFAKLPEVIDAKCNPTIWSFAGTAAIIWDVSPVPAFIIYIALAQTSYSNDLGLSDW